MGRKKNSLPSVAVIGLVILMVILYTIATHPWILIPIIGIPIAVILIYRNRKKKRELQYLEALRSMSVSDLDGLNGLEFERFLKTLFELDGCKVQLTKPSRDMGADLIVKRNGKTMAVQAKRYDGKVGVGAVQQVVSSINIYKTDGGIVITNSEFTSPAITLAKANSIELIDRGDLENLIVDVYKRKSKNDKKI